MPVKWIDVNGIPARIRTVAASAANGTGRRMSACASRYQAPRSRGVAACRRTGSALMRGPSRKKSGGRTVSETSPASGPTSAPAIPIERRNPSGKTASVAIETPTVTELNATVRPAVATVARTASAPGPRWASSSR